MTRERPGPMPIHPTPYADALAMISALLRIAERAAQTPGERETIRRAWIMTGETRRNA